MRRLVKEMLRIFRRQKGFSLLEVLIAVGILGFVGAGVVTALDTNSRATLTLDQQVTATNLASAFLEQIKELSYDSTYPNIGDDITIPPQYSVDIDIYFSDNGTAWVDTYNSETLQKIIISISKGERPILSICTYKTEK